MMLYNTQNYWVCEFCPSFGILNNYRTQRFRNWICSQWLRLVLYMWPNRIMSSSLARRWEETLCFLLRILGDGQSPQSHGCWSVLQFSRFKGNPRIASYKHSLIIHQLDIGTSRQSMMQSLKSSLNIIYEMLSNMWRSPFMASCKPGFINIDQCKWKSKC
jgi:hypothetical protein